MSELPQFVDLSLASDNLWMTCNLGAEILKVLEMTDPDNIIFMHKKEHIEYHKTHGTN